MALRGGLANTGAGFVLFGSCFSVVLLVVRSLGSCFLVVLSVVRSFGFVLLVVLFVVRAFWSFFSWFVLLGARMCFLFDALKVLEACVARSEVS